MSKGFRNLMTVVLSAVVTIIILTLIYSSPAEALTVDTSKPALVVHLTEDESNQCDQEDGCELITMKALKELRKLADEAIAMKSTCWKHL